MTTNIAWTDETWNPTVGCSRVSAGCERCYAEVMTKRLEAMGYGRGGKEQFEQYRELTRGTGQGVRWSGVVKLVPDRLIRPLRWRKPRRVFVDSMSDLFHEKVPDEYIARVFAVMLLAHAHTFQVLTKRPERMREWASDPGTPEQVARWMTQFSTPRVIADRVPEMLRPGWPLRNVWLGVSCEDQATADERIPLLLQTPAAVRFLSVEPMLGPISFRWADWHDYYQPGWRERGEVQGHLDGLRNIDWIIVGGESGPGARPCDVAWIRSIVEQCRETDTACFVKQLGARPYEGHSEIDHCCDEAHKHPGQHPLGRLDADGITRPLRSRKGSDPAEWPKDLRCREFPR